MRLALPILLLVMVAACGTDPVVEDVTSAQPASAITAPDSATSHVRSGDTLSPVPAPDTTAPPKQRPHARVPAEPLCQEEIYAENNQGRITVFIPKKQLASRTSEIRDLLPSVFIQAERTSPHAIADDFEHGVSTEYSSMPDKLPVDVLVFERCRSARPHTVLHLRVWREADGSYGSEGW